MPTELLMSAVELRMAVARDAAPPAFELTAYTGGALRPYSPRLDAPLVVDLAGVTSPDRIPALLDHRDDLIVGQTTRVAVGPSDIRMVGIITADVTGDENVSPGAKVVAHARRGFIWPVSMGAEIRRMESVRTGASVDVNGQHFNGPLYVARDVVLNHVAFLSVAADQAATARIAASGKRESPMDFHDWLKGIGFSDPAVLTEMQRTQLEARYTKEKETVTPTVDPPSDSERAAKSPRKRSESLAALKARQKRDNDMNELAVKYGKQYPSAIAIIEDRLEAALADEEMTPTDFENYILRECTRYERVDTRPKRGTGEEGIGNPLEIEAALCRTGGLPEKSLTKAFSQQVLEASHRRYRRGLSLCEFLEMASAANGFRGSFRSDTEDVLLHALPARNLRGRRDLTAAGPSTYDVADILGNVMNRFVVDYFMGVDATAMRMISATRPVRDFRQIESYSLSGDMTYERVAPGGEIKHGTLGTEKYTNQADTYARMIGIDRRDLINDDLGAFSRVGQRLGRGGILALLDVFWTAFINNSSFFTTQRSNFKDGSDTALSLDALSAAKVMFNLLKDPNGRTMNVTPRILLVPPELEATAATILNSQLVVIRGDAEAVMGNANIHAGTLDLAMARELSNERYTGYSAKKWYLLASPNDVPVIETCFLNGVDRPTVEGAQADFDTLGIKMRAFFDFGVAKQEYRGGVAMKGEV